MVIPKAIETKNLVEGFVTVLEPFLQSRLLMMS